MRSSKSLGDSSLVLPSGVSVLFSNFNVFTAWNFVQVHGLYTQYFLIYIIRRLNDNEFLFFSEWPIEHVYCTFTNTFLVECLLNMHPYWLDNTSYRPNKLETVLSHFTNMFNSETRCKDLLVLLPFEMNLLKCYIYNEEKTESHHKTTETSVRLWILLIFEIPKALFKKKTLSTPSCWLHGFQVKFSSHCHFTS